MRRKPKARVGLIVGGEVRELFSIRERGKNKGLVIMPKLAEQLVDETGGFADAAGEHYSIHPSVESDGYTIKHTMEFADGRELDIAQFRYPSDKGLLTIVYSKARQDLSPARYLMNAGPKDSVFLLRGYDIGKITFVYHFFVSSYLIKDVILLNIPGYIHLIPIGELYIYIFSSFFNVPAFSQSSKLGSSTSGRQLNRVFLENIEDLVDLQAMSSETIANMIVVNTQLLADIHYERLRNYTFSDGTKLNDEDLVNLRELFSLVTADPAGQAPYSDS